jgi:hypothetical protein
MDVVKTAVWLLLIIGGALLGIGTSGWIGGAAFCFLVAVLLAWARNSA